MNKKKILIIILFLLIGLGYALLTQELTINGTAGISSNTWDIHFANPVVNSSSVSDTIPLLDSQSTTLTYEVELEKPGDFYEFTVDIVNAGTIDAMIDNISLTVNGSDSIPEIIDISATYADGIDIDRFHLLHASELDTIKINTTFIKDIEVSDLPNDDISYYISINIQYIQADNRGFERPIDTYLYFVANYSFKNFQIGETIPNDILNHENMYFSLESVKENFPYPIFGHSIIVKIRYTAEIVTELYLGFETDDEIYFLRGGDGGASYESNKDILDTLSLSCEENTEYGRYSITDRDFLYNVLDIYNDGTIRISDGTSVAWTISDTGYFLEQPC